MTFALHIPVKPHVRKYLIKVFGSDSFHLVKGNHILLMINRMMERPPFGWRPRKVDTCKVTVIISDDTSRRVPGIYISEANIKTFNNYIADLMRSELYYTVDAGLKYTGQDIKDLIMEFREKYDIQESDLAFETMKKMYYRYRINTNGLILRR